MEDENGREVYDPGISTADFSGGIIMYRIVDEKDTYAYKHKFSETYQEALEAIHKSDY